MRRRGGTMTRYLRGYEGRAWSIVICGTAVMEWREDTTRGERLRMTRQRTTIERNEMEYALGDTAVTMMGEKQKLKRGNSV